MKLEFESNTATLPFPANNISAPKRPEIGSERISQILQSGIKAAQSGNRNEARVLLVQVTEAEPRNETAWLWMASISEYPEELIIFLNNVLSINPHNTRALEWMKATKSLLAKTFVQRGNDAVLDANKDFAVQCYLQAVVHDNQNEAAWQALAEISESPEEKISYWQKVFDLNPNNEAASNALQAVRQQSAEAMLQKANRAAISGDRAAAREMLLEVFEYAPDLEEAWILKSYLADSFSEKITCFEKVLTLNPENEMAISGLASLRAMMAKTEAKKAEQAAIIADFDKKVAEKEAQEILAATEEPNDFEEESDENSPTQELEFPPDFVSELQTGALTEMPVALSDFSIQASDSDDAKSTDDNFYQETESAQTEFEETLTADEPSAATDYMHNFEKAEMNSFTGSEPSNGDAFSASIYTGENSSKTVGEMLVCPFCYAENEANAFVCNSCRTILTLSDLEMLLAHTETDQELLRQAVERMETEKNTRPFSAVELKNLAIGQINLKNLRPAVNYLQKAAQMSPNDVMLGAQVNFLKIRLSEIEQQESANSQMLKNRRILIVDDSATVRKLISSKLEKSGHEVLCAVDGVDALDKIKEFTPDLILLDIMMPQLDGYQVCKLIRSNESTKDVPVVMISGKDGFFDKVRGRMAGTTGYITKPFGPETLMKTVETYITQKGGMMVENEEVD